VFAADLAGAAAAAAAVAAAAGGNPGACLRRGQHVYHGKAHERDADGAPCMARGEFVELVLTRDGEGMVHAQWRDRATGDVAFDTVVFPGDVTLRRVRTPAAKDRVYELRYVAGAARPCGIASVSPASPPPGVCQATRPHCGSSRCWRRA
jgi:hypothetical protein